IIALVLFIIIAIPRLKESFQIFASTGKDVQRGISGTNFIIWGVVIEFIAGVLALIFLFTIPVLILASGVLLVIGFIILFLGELFIGLSLYNLGKFYNNDLLKIGGIIEIIPPISFIGWILTYVAVDDVMRRITGVPPQIPPTSQPQAILIYQVGFGSIRPDGTATFTLYSNQKDIRILSALIEGTTVLAQIEQINPNVLVEGSNNITIKFQGITGLIVGNTYTISLNLSNGQIVKVSVIATSQ
ncbi:MAG: DUF973 family protein, partial [Sulfolobaceae archaeon]